MSNNLDDHDTPEDINGPAMDNHGRLRESPSEVIQTSLDARLADWQRRNLQVSVVGNKLKIQPWAKLSADDRAFIAANREPLKNRVRAESLPPEREPRFMSTPVVPVVAPVEPLPVVSGYQVTEDDVLYCLRCDGDETLATYKSGQLSRATAISMAVCWIRQRQSLPPQPASDIRMTTKRRKS